ncbi:MAG: iron ABC transporter permease [Actinomycetota bacterium]
MITESDFGALMQSANRRRPSRALVVMALISLVAWSLSIRYSIGQVTLSPAAAVRGLFKTEGSSPFEQIAVLARMPRATMAILIGGGLGAAGALLQSLYRNPLAGPGITGVSPGATTAVVLFVVYGPTLSTDATALVTPMVAILGGALTAGITFAISSLAGRADPLRLILVGILLGGVLGTITSLILLTEGQNAISIIRFLAGSIDVIGWTQVRVVAIASVLLAPLIVYCIPLGNVLALGDDMAHGMGERVARARLLMLFTAASITAVAVAFVGGMVFVGLIAPHVARRYVGGDLRRLVPASCLTGSSLVLVGDLLARSIRPAEWDLPFPVAPTTLPAGMYLSLIGAVFFARVVRRTP